MHLDGSVILAVAGAVPDSHFPAPPCAQTGDKFEFNLNGSVLLAVAGAYLIYVMTSSGNTAGQPAGGTHEITFQDFQSRLLPQGVVTRLEVANGTLCKVCVCVCMGACMLVLVLVSV